MKKLVQPLMIIALTFLSCKKEEEKMPMPRPPVFVQQNTGPSVSAGGFKWVVMPSNFTVLSGNAYDRENNIRSYLWKKVGGPVNHKIESPAALTTKVENLEVGTYLFELTVTDMDGLTGKDTVTVSVQAAPPQGPGQVIFENQQWHCPMGCTISIDCFYCIVPKGHPFKIYIKQQNTTQWIEVLHEDQWGTGAKFLYSIYDNQMLIWGDGNQNVKVDVRIEW